MWLIAHKMILSSVFIDKKTGKKKEKSEILLF